MKWNGMEYKVNRIDRYITEILNNIIFEIEIGFDGQSERILNHV